MTQGSDQIAQALWPNGDGDGVGVMACLHKQDFTRPLMCADHLTSGLMCEACLITHVGMKHEAGNPSDTDIPAECSLCQEPIPPDQRDNARLVAEQLGVYVMRTAHDVLGLMHPTANVLVTGHVHGNLIDGVYSGPIRLWGSLWLCDRCRSTTPPETVIVWEVSPTNSNP